MKLANLIICAHGLVMGWSSTALAYLSSPDSPLSDGPLTNEQLSWIGSIGCVGSVFGSLCYGYVISILHCKRASILVTIPNCVFWVLVYFGNSFYDILIARFLSGFSGGCMVISVTLYISEIANDKYIIQFT